MFMTKISKDTSKILFLFLRYIIIILAGLGNLYIFYTFFTPLTTKAISLILSLFDTTTTTANWIYFKHLIIVLIPACIAGSAYYLLLILNLATPGIKTIKRIKILTLSFLTLFIFNVLRILLLIAINKTAYFETAHLFFWYGLSTIFVAGLWILSVKYFKIKQYPAYSDLSFLYSLIRKGNKKKK